MIDHAKLVNQYRDARKPKKPTTVPHSPAEFIQNRALAYTERHRRQWFKPEYDFKKIIEIEDIESYFAQTVAKKTSRLIGAGWEFHGSNKEAVDYVVRRFKEIAKASKLPTEILFTQIVQSLERISNCMLVKARSRTASTGRVTVGMDGIEVDPIAGLFILPFETLEFKTKPNGDLLRVLQRMPSGEEKEFPSRDLLHIYKSKKPGFATGTPAVISVIDDMALLRGIEQNVQELIETNLFPLFHYKIGTDKLPERSTREGYSEVDRAKRDFEYMPSHGMYITDHRHEILAIGSESKALRIDYYLGYFKQRVLSGLGISPMDLGEPVGGGGTANAMSKALIQDIEATQFILKSFIENGIIHDLLYEGGYDPLGDDAVEIKFGVIDREERTKLENQAIQLFINNLVTSTEARHLLGKPAMTEEELDDTFFKKFEEPLALVKSMVPGSAAGETLSEHPSSNITPEAVANEKKFAQQQQKEQLRAKAGAPGSRPASSTGKRTSASKSRPSNQHGTRSSPKFSKDHEFESLLAKYPDLSAEYESAIVQLNDSLDRQVAMTGCSAETVRSILQHRYDAVCKKLLERIDA